MTSMSHPLMRLLGLASLLLVLGPSVDCSLGEIAFTPEDDDAVMASILGKKSAGQFVLSLTEDDARASAEQAIRDNGCQIDHIVRDNGQGIAKTRQEPSNVGCGGCPFDVVAFVQAELDHPALEAPLKLSGRVKLGSSWDDDPYAPPYVVGLQAEGSTAWIEGELDAAGDFKVSVWKLPFALPTFPQLLRQDVGAN